MHICKQKHRISKTIFNVTELPEQILRAAAILTHDAPAIEFWSLDAKAILRRAAEIRSRLAQERGRVLDDAPVVAAGTK